MPGELTGIVIYDQNDIYLTNVGTNEITRSNWQTGVGGNAVLISGIVGAYQIAVTV